jgi:hypothetical protein
VNAVVCASLMSTKNVVVFSSDPTGPSIVSCCSGGDLDGDHYCIIYDSSLVPPRTLQYPSLDYDAVRTNAQQLSVQSAASEEEYYVRVISKNILGRVSVLHTAFSDLSPLGAHDPISIKLAEASSIAVDSPKTGLVPMIPEDAALKVRCIYIYILQLPSLFFMLLMNLVVT